MKHVTICATDWKEKTRRMGRRERKKEKTLQSAFNSKQKFFSFSFEGNLLVVLAPPSVADAVAVYFVTGGPGCAISFPLASHCHCPAVDCSVLRKFTLCFLMDSLLAAGRVKAPAQRGNFTCINRSRRRFCYRPWEWAFLPSHRVSLISNTAICRLIIAHCRQSSHFFCFNGTTQSPSYLLLDLQYELKY